MISFCSARQDKLEMTVYFIVKVFEAVCRTRQFDVEHFFTTQPSAKTSNKLPFPQSALFVQRMTNSTIALPRSGPPHATL
jgi:hypothetical protein